MFVFRQFGFRVHGIAMLTVVINQTTQDDRSDRVLTHPCSLRSACFFSDEGSERRGFRSRGVESLPRAADTNSRKAWRAEVQVRRAGHVLHITDLVA